LQTLYVDWSNSTHNSIQAHISLCNVKLLRHATYLQHGGVYYCRVQTQNDIAERLSQV